MKTSLLSFLLLFTLFTVQAQWAPFAPGTTNGTVIDLQWYQGDLYAGGFFTTINGDNANSVAQWDGSNWQPVGGGLSDGVHNLEEIDSVLYAVRYELQVDSNWVYYLQGGNWEKLGGGFWLDGANTGQFYTPSMYDVKQYNGEIYACGEFTHNGDSSMNRIARWDGTDWNAVAGGLSDPFFGQTVYPHQMLVFGGKLYVCGNFTQANGVTVNGVAAWDGTNWTAMGDGFNSTVYALGVFDNVLYAGGDFTASGSNPLGAIAKWDGTNWVSPGFEFQYSSPNGYLFVHTIKQLNQHLYILGGFDQVVPDGQSALTAGSVISFDGIQIDILGGGVDNDAESITDYLGNILVGGIFSTAGTGVQVDHLALYDSTVTTRSAPITSTSEIRLYPNPAKESFALQGVDWGTAFEIHTITGSSMCKGTYQDEISLAGFHPGVYMLTIYQNGRRETLKFVKQ